MTNRTKAIIGLSSVFLLGTICGSLLFGVIVRDRAGEMRRLRHRDGFIEHFAHRLELTEAQRDSLRDELEQAYDSLTSLRQAASVQYNAVFDTLERRIAPQLTEEQRLLFKSQEQKLRRLMPREPHRAGRRSRGHGASRSEMLPPDHGGEDRLSQGPKDDSSRRPKSYALSSEEKPSIADSAIAQSAPNSSTPQPTPDEVLVTGLDRHREVMRKRLGLRDDQVAEIDKILREVQRKNAEARKTYADSPMLRRSAFRDNFRETRRQIAALLDADQRKEYKKMEEEFRVRRRRVQAGR